MNPSSSVSYDLAQARIADLRHQARREGLARAVAHSPRPDRPRGSGRLRIRSVLRRRAAATAS
jgi:hypothetical protein